MTVHDPEASDPGGIRLDLSEIECVSGTAEDGPTKFRPFVTVRCVASNGDVLLGQMDVTTCRQLGHQFLEVAEAAEADAIIFTILTRDLEVPSPIAARVVAAMRDERIQ